MQLETSPHAETAAVVALDPNQGEAIWFLDQLMIVKLRGPDTPYGIAEAVLEADRSTPFHRHHAEAETFYVLDGELSIFVEDGRTIHGVPGSTVHLPCGVAHGFRTLSRVRLLVLSAARGFVDFTREYGLPAPRLTTPPQVAPDFPRLEALARKYSIELLGPLPE